MKEANKGIYNREVIKRNIKMLTDPEIREIGRQTREREGTGIYNKENQIKASAIANKNMKQKSCGVYNKEHLENMISRSRESRIKNKVGFHTKEIRQKARSTIKENTYKFIDSLDVRINNEHSLIGLQNIDKYNGIPGVWSIWSNDICLDVCETIDIGNEIRLALRKLKSNKIEKYKTINKHEDLVFIIVETGITLKEDRLIIEAKYASENKARLWYPAPNQIKTIRNYSNTKYKDSI